MSNEQITCIHRRPGGHMCPHCMSLSDKRITTAGIHHTSPGDIVRVTGTGPQGWRRKWAWVKWFLWRAPKPNQNDGTFTVTSVNHSLGMDIDTKTEFDIKKIK